MGREVPPTGVEVRFDAAVYAVDSVKKAAYRFLDRFAPDIEIRGGEIVCRLVFDDRTLEADLIQAILAEFRKEVLDQDLRRAIAEETSPVRNTVLALAFAPSNLQDK